MMDRCFWRTGLLLSAAVLLGACAAVLEKPTRPLVFDFGPGTLSVAEAATPSLPGVMLAEVEAPGALDGTAILYRLAFANVQQLMPYGAARWSMPPAQLVRQRLQDVLGQKRLVSASSDSATMAAGGSSPARVSVALRVELEEFTQYFEAADRSFGLLRLRATASSTGTAGERVLGQRTFVVRRPAPSADAAGGVRALTDATSAAALELESWLSQLR